MLMVTLEGNISNLDRDGVTYKSGELFPDDVIILGETKLALDFADVNQVGTLVNIIISIISLLLTVRQNRTEQHEKEITSLEHIRERVAQELLKYQIKDFSISKLEGIENYLKGDKGSSCKVIITAENSIYHVILSRKGSVHVIQVI